MVVFCVLEMCCYRYISMIRAGNSMFVFRTLWALNFSTSFRQLIIPAMLTLPAKYGLCVLVHPLFRFCVIFLAYSLLIVALPFRSLFLFCSFLFAHTYSFVLILRCLRHQKTGDRLLQPRCRFRPRRTSADSTAAKRSGAVATTLRRHSGRIPLCKAV